MRRLTIAALSALILLCVSISTPQGRGLHSIRWTPLVINLLMAEAQVATSPRPRASPAQAPGSESGSAPGAQEIISLEPGKPVERELSGGQSHSYKITMISGQYLRIVIEQRGIDVAVALFTPDGKKINEVNSDPLIEGSETVSAIAKAPGAYLIEVRSSEKTAKTGRYEIKVEELRAATAEDKYRVAGEMIFREAERLQNGTLEAKRKSVENYHEALELYRRAGYRYGEAAALNSIGDIYRSLGEMQKALEKLNEALPISQAVSDRKMEGETLNNIGLVYRSLGETQKALEKYNEALPIRRAVGDRRGEANTLSNIGIVYDALSDMQKALEKYNEALAIKRAIGDRRGEDTILHNIGKVYRAMGEPQKAMEKFNEALLLSRELGDRSGEAITLTNIGGVYRELGDMQKALEKYNEALPIRQAISDRRGEAVTLGNIGTDYRSLGDMQKALEKHNEALPIFRALGFRREEATTLSSIGLIYHSLRETQKALEIYNEALPISQATGDRFTEAQTLLGIAQVEQKRGNLTLARQSLEQAVGIIESLRANISGQGLRAFFFASRQEIYQSYIDVLMQMHKQNPAAAFDSLALEISERARARSLLELLKESRADIRQGGDSSLLERERSLRRQINEKAAAEVRLLSRKHTPEEAAAAAKEIAAITTEYEEL